MEAGGPQGSDHILAIVAPSARDFSGIGLIADKPFARFGDTALRAALAAQGPRALGGSPANCTLPAQDCAAFGAAVIEIVEIP